MEALEHVILSHTMLRQIASDLSRLDPSSADEHWVYLGQAVQTTLKNLESSTPDLDSDATAN